jgi:hypothetical protein
MAMDEDMAYWLSDKIRTPSSIFNCPAFMLKEPVPGNTRFKRLRVLPPTEFSWDNAKDIAGLLLSEAFSNGFLYNINHGFFNLNFKMAG